MGVAHWDDVESYRRAKGEMDGTWQRLGEAAGTKGVGVNRVRVAPGKLPTPPHSHGASEEVFFVLAGSGLAWQDEQVHEVRPGDCVIHRANELEHTFVARPGRARLPRLRHQAPDGFRLAAWVRRGPVRLALGRGAHRRSLGSRGRGATLCLRRAGRAAAERRQRRRGRARAVGVGDDGSARHDAALRPGRLPGSGSTRVRGVGAPLPLRRGGGLRHSRGRRNARALAFARRGSARCRGTRGHSHPCRPCRRTATRDAHRPLLPGPVRTA